MAYDTMAHCTTPSDARGNKFFSVEVFLIRETTQAYVTLDRFTQTTRSFAIMHAAVYDAVNAIDATHEHTPLTK